MTREQVAMKQETIRRIDEINERKGYLKGALYVIENIDKILSVLEKDPERYSATIEKELKLLSIELNGLKMLRMW